MYRFADLARFTLSEFERGLEGLTDEEARHRPLKADGACMNSISWTIAHLAWHWHRIDALATDAPVPPDLERFGSGSTDPTPPPLEQAREWLARARTIAERLAVADAATLERTGRSPESVGTQLMRATLHAWFHAGEINAIRQLLGHPEIRMIGHLHGHLEWFAEGAADNMIA